MILYEFIKKTNDDQQEDTPAPIVPSASVLNEIAHAKQLLDAEIITQEEFVAIKAKLIEKI